MASYAVAAGELAAYEKTLVAATVDTVTFTNPRGSVEITTDGTASVFLTVDGSTPTVAGAKMLMVPAGSGPQVRRFATRSNADLVVKLISAATPKYSAVGCA